MFASCHLHHGLKVWLCAWRIVGFESRGKGAAERSRCIVWLADYSASSCCRNRGFTRLPGSFGGVSRSGLHGWLGRTPNARAQQQDAWRQGARQIHRQLSDICCAAGLAWCAGRRSAMRPALFRTSDAPAGAEGAATLARPTPERWPAPGYCRERPRSPDQRWGADPEAA